MQDVDVRMGRGSARCGQGDGKLKITELLWMSFIDGPYERTNSMKDTHHIMIVTTVNTKHSTAYHISTS